MTMTTEPTIESLPTWINLDEIVPPEHREELNSLAAQLEELAPQIEKLARHAYLAHRGYEELLAESGVDDIDDFASEVLAPHTGEGRLHDVCRHIAEYVCLAIGDKPNWVGVDWYERPGEVRAGLE